MPPIIQKSLQENVQKNTTSWILGPHYSHDRGWKNFVSWSDIANLDCQGLGGSLRLTPETYAVGCQSSPKAEVYPPVS